MPKRSRKEPGDSNLNAARIAAIATGQEPPKPAKPVKPPAGRKGGKVGGKARAASLTAEERRAIAVKAARARWGMEDEA